MEEVSALSCPTVYTPPLPWCKPSDSNSRANVNESNMIETVQWKNCDVHIKLLQEKETEIQELKFLLNRQKHELRQGWKTEESEVQLYGTQQTNNAPLFQDQHLRTSTRQAEIFEAHQNNEHLQTSTEEFQCVNDQLSPTNVDMDAQLHDFQTKNINLLERNAKKQPTAADRIQNDYTYWCQMSRVQELIVNLQTAVDEVKEDNSKLQWMISKLHLKHEQIHPIIVELQSHVHPTDASVEDKLCNKADAGNEGQEHHLRSLKLHDQSNHLKAMSMDLDKKQSRQEMLCSQMQDTASQFQYVMGILQKGIKQMQAIISKLDEKRSQFEKMIPGLQRNAAKLQATISHCVQLCAVSELQDMKKENLKLQFKNRELQVKISQLQKSKHWLEISLSTLKGRVYQLEVNKSDNQILQYKVRDLQNKSDEYINTIIKLQSENVALQKNHSDLQGYKKQLLATIAELQSKALKLEGVDLQNKKLQFLVTDLLGRNTELNNKIREFAEKNNTLEEYLLQVQQNLSHHRIANVELQEYTRPQIRTAEARESEYQFKTSSSEMQTVLGILSITGTMKEKLQVSISDHQQHVSEAQDNILKLHRRINSLHQLTTELQKYSQQCSLSVLELQDKISMTVIRKAENQCVPVFCQGKESYNERMVCMPMLEAMSESSCTRLPTSSENSLIHAILKVIKLSTDIELSIKNIGMETKHLQSLFFDLEVKIIKMQLHKDGLVNSEEGTLEEIIQQLKEHKHALEKYEDEKAHLKQKIFELDERLAEEKSFSNKAEAQIHIQQQAANYEIKKLQTSLKDLLSNNLKLEKTIKWSLERNAVLGIKLDALENILIEEQVKFSEKEVNLIYQWQKYMNQVEHLQCTLSEMVTENTDLKETVKMHDQEKAHLHATVSELQSRLQSGKLNIKVQHDDQLHAKSSSSRPYETKQPSNVKLSRSMLDFEGVQELPGNRMDKPKMKLAERIIPFDENGSQIKSEEKTIDHDRNSCPEAIIKELVDKSDKDCEVHVAVEKSRSVVDLLNPEISVSFADKILFCTGSETSDMLNQSTLDVFKNSPMLKMPNELMEFNKQLNAYIEDLTEEKYLLTVMVSELTKKVTEMQQQIESELQIIIDPMQSENEQLFDHINVLEELEKKTSRNEFNCSGPSVQMEIQKDAENNQLKSKVKDLQKKNKDFRMYIKNHESKKLSENILIEKEDILSLEQENYCELQSQMNYKFQLLKNQKCQVENMVGDLLGSSITLAIDVDELLLQLTEDEMDSDLEEKHCFSKLQAKIAEPEEKMCEIIEVQREAKDTEETKKFTEKYRVEKEHLIESLLKFKILLKNQQIYCRTCVNLTNEIKEGDIKIQQLQEKMNSLTYNSSNLQETDTKFREEIQNSNICNSEAQNSKLVSMDSGHLNCNITSSNYTGQHYLEGRRYLQSYVQPPRVKNESKILNLQNIQQLEATKELQNNSEIIQEIVEKPKREKNMLELKETQHIERLDVEQCPSNKLTVYMKNKCKVLANQNNYFQHTITQLLNEVTAFRVLIDNLEQVRKLLMIKITELNNKVKTFETCCNDKAKENVLKSIDLQSHLKGLENNRINFLADNVEVDRDTVLPSIINPLIDTGNELQDNETRSQQAMNSRVLIETTSNLQDKIFEEHKFSSALSKTSQINSENIYQQKLKKIPPENLHLHNEGFGEGKVKFIDSESKEEKVTFNKILFQPDSRRDFTSTVQEREMMDIAPESLLGEINIPEESAFNLERSISESQHVHETKGTNTVRERINEAINNFQGRNQQTNKQKFTASANLCMVDEENLYTGRTNCQCGLNWNCTEPEVRRFQLQETAETIHNLGDLKTGNIRTKKQTWLAADSKLPHKIKEEFSETEKATSLCANEAPMIYISQHEKAVVSLNRVGEPNGVTLNNQEDKDLLKVIVNDQEREHSEAEFKNADYIDQRLSIKSMAVITEFKELKFSDSGQITEDSEPQKDNKNLEVAGTDLVNKTESALIEEDINSLNSLTAEEITAQEMLEEENNASMWMKCMIQ
ncbi:uncharacterized protein [Hemitrygon akajei]|uniref:uncharacterized protein n=1 Tax=Hemitrygon akajei TaxID=2704970 RepID=UPI003BF94FE3